MNRQDSKALARYRREEELEDLRDGRKRRAQKFASARDYRRRPKHGKWGDQS
jgi:hypothetical protein